MADPKPDLNHKKIKFTEPEREHYYKRFDALVFFHRAFFSSGKGNAQLAQDIF